MKRTEGINVGVMACCVCGKPCSRVIIEIGCEYFRLCEDCYDKEKDKTIEELRKD